MKKGFKGLLVIGVILLIFALSFKSIMMFIFPQKYSEYVEKYSYIYGVEETLIYSVIKTESGFDEEAVSPVDAQGLMQIMPSTGEWLAEQLNIEGYTDDLLKDPQINIMLGTWYLDKLIEQYDGKIELALAAYNAGSGNVDQWLVDEEYSSDGERLDIIPFGETDRYVDKVLFIERVYEWLYSEP